MQLTINRAAKMMLLAMLVLLVAPTAVFAQEGGEAVASTWGYMGAGIGADLPSIPVTGPDVIAQPTERSSEAIACSRWAKRRWKSIRKFNNVR